MEKKHAPNICKISCWQTFLSQAAHSLNITSPYIPQTVDCQNTCTIGTSTWVRYQENGDSIETEDHPKPHQRVHDVGRTTSQVRDSVIL